jgi:stage V sporulation protein AA
MAPRTEMHIYLQFRANIKYKPGQSLLVKDVAWISGDGVERIAQIPLVEKASGRPIVIQAVDLVRRVQEQNPDVIVHILGEGKTMAEPVSRNKKQGTGPWLWVRASGVGILLFFGAMLSILYFHADVNMPEVHRTMWGLLTGEQGRNPLPFNIAYTLGIPAGVLLFMGGFKSKKANKKPGSLELSEYEYEKSLYQFMRDEEEKES